MKMILAIVSSDDSSRVSKHLTRHGYFATKLSTTGGFLMAGNTTFLIGVEDDKVDDVLGIISRHSSKRTQTMPTQSAIGAFPVQVTVGGATVFVLNVERFEKM